MVYCLKKEEYDDEGIKKDLSFIDQTRTRRYTITWIDSIQYEKMNKSRLATSSFFLDRHDDHWDESIGGDNVDSIITDIGRVQKYQCRVDGRRGIFRQSKRRHVYRAEKKRVERSQILHPERNHRRRRRVPLCAIRLKDESEEQNMDSSKKYFLRLKKMFRAVPNILRSVISYSGNWKTRWT